MDAKISFTLNGKSRTVKEGEHTTPCHFWCNRTQTVVGVDDRPVHKDACTPGRVCFEE